MAFVDLARPNLFEGSSGRPLSSAGHVEVQNSLAQFRRQRGISAARLASAVGISRQTVYAIESGSYLPNTSVALKLARALEVNVEQLFSLEKTPGHPLYRRS